MPSDELLQTRLRSFVESLADANVDTSIIFEAADALDEWDNYFDLYHAAMMRGIAMWRAANPGNDLVMPDSGKLVEWLIERTTDRWRPIADAEMLVPVASYFPYRCLIQTTDGYVLGASAGWASNGLRWYEGSITNGRWIRNAKYFMLMPAPRKD